MAHAIVSADSYGVGVIGWSIMTGDPVNGFSLNGNFETGEEATGYANGDPHLDDEWWIVPIYPVESN